MADEEGDTIMVGVVVDVHDKNTPENNGISGKSWLSSCLFFDLLVDRRCRSLIVDR